MDDRRKEKKEELKEKLQRIQDELEALVQENAESGEVLCLNYFLNEAQKDLEDAAAGYQQRPQYGPVSPH